MFRHNRVPMKINPTHNMDPPYPNSTPHPVTFEIFYYSFAIVKSMAYHQNTSFTVTSVV